MKYTKEEVMQYVEMEDVMFIRLAFCDVFGTQKNIAILPTELKRAFEQGIAIDASAIAGFGGEVKSDLFLHPDPSTLESLPWRSENGQVVRMFCTVTYPDGKELESDSRTILQKAVNEAAKRGLSFDIGAEMEFYLFNTDENGDPTRIPYDRAGYMDIAPDDKGENIRRAICLTLSQMGIQPETSHHEEGPGQNEIDFRYSDPISAADNALTFRSVVKTIVARNGLVAEFSPKPLKDQPGSGLHINISVESSDGEDKLPYVIAGILAKVKEITAFLNPCEESYERLGNRKAPRYISWSSENRSQLVRVPATPGKNPRAELRSPDPMANPYLAFALLIYASLYGIDNRLELPKSADLNFFTADEEMKAQYDHLPETLKEAMELAKNSEFVKSILDATVIEAYCQRAEE